MWYTHAYNQSLGMGGGILPPLPKNGNKIATPSEKRILEEEIISNNLNCPDEEKTLQKKLEAKHTNGYFPSPITTFQGQNPPAAIEDQHPSSPITGNEYDDYESTRM